MGIIGPHPGIDERIKRDCICKVPETLPGIYIIDDNKMTTIIVNFYKNKILIYGKMGSL